MANITITIPDGEEAAFIQAFLRANPIPNLNEDGQPDMTARQWVKACLIQHLRTQYRRGVLALQQDQLPPNDASTKVPD